MSRSKHWANGHRSGQKDVLRRLYDIIDEMNDPHAKMVLCYVADTIGKRVKRRWLEANRES